TLWTRPKDSLELQLNAKPQRSPVPACLLSPGKPAGPRSTEGTSPETPRLRREELSDLRLGGGAIK
ncbi:mCG146178, partial [Mus musculus]